MTIKKKYLTIVTLFYVYIPVLVFLFGFTKLWIAIAAAFIIGLCGWKFVNKIEDESYKINAYVGVGIIAVFLLVGYYAGWGRFTMQAADWIKHDSVLSDLVKRRWPVIYENNGNKSMLSYYIGQYLVPALIGKITGSVRVAEIALYVWNEIGLLLIYLNLVYVLKSISPVMQVLSGLCIPFFGLPIWLSQVVLKLVTGIDGIGETAWYYRGEGIAIQYSNSFALLRWVFPQALAGWILILLFLEYKDQIENYLFLLIPGVLYATLSFVGIVPIAVAYAFERLFCDKNLKGWMLKVLSLDNILILLSQGIIYILYFAGNVFSEKPEYLGFRRVDYSGNWAIYLVFVIVNVLIYACLLFEDNKSNSIYYAVVVVLLVLPLFSIGRYNDLCMRSSIPAIFLVGVMMLTYMRDHFKELLGKNNIIRQLKTVILVGLVIIGAIYPLMDIAEVAKIPYTEDMGKGMSISVLTMENFANRDNPEIEDDLKYNYYTYDCDGDAFIKYLAR